METIYTIPINEAFDKADGCPFCRLVGKYEQDTLDYTLGAAMMEPNVRIEMNRLGFCRRHFGELAGRKNKLALALILETRLDEVIAKGSDALLDSCFVCGTVRANEERYISNAVHMFAKDEQFRGKIAQQEYFCLPHLRMLLAAGQKQLKRRQFSEFSALVLDLERKKLSVLKADARKFADSFDYRNSAQEVGDEKFVFNKMLLVS